MRIPSSPTDSCLLHLLRRENLTPLFPPLYTPLCFPSSSSFPLPSTHITISVSPVYNITEPLEAPPELAKITGELAAQEHRNREVVIQLYEALSDRDGERVQSLLAPDLEWWFHGPRCNQHMKRLLTGTADDNFQFRTHSVEAFGPTVVAEGTDIAASVFWVHAWTVSDGVITQVREYFNTSLTVTRFDTTVCAASTARCLPVWESRLSGAAGKTQPGLVLAI